jgi:DNA-binding transcriptional MocR family regulator
VLDLVRAMGLVAIPVPVDDAGPTAAGLEAALAARPAAVVITPRAQNPTGAALDDGRCAELAEVLERHPEPVVVEDDHAGPVAGTPALTLCRGRRSWAVVRSVSKWLGPDLRVAVLAGDRTTVARVEGRQAVGTGWVSHLLQAVTADLWGRRSSEAVLTRAARAYAERRSAVLEALADEGIDAHGRSGLHVWVPVPEEQPVVAGLLARGWAVTAGERFRVRSGPGVRVCIAALLPEEARPFAADLATALHPTVAARLA